MGDRGVQSFFALGKSLDKIVVFVIKSKTYTKSNHTLYPLYEHSLCLSSTRKLFPSLYISVKRNTIELMEMLCVDYITTKEAVK